MAVIAIWLGTLLFPFATLFFSHALAAALLVFAFYLLFQLRQNDGTLSVGRLGRAGAAGFFLSCSVVTELPRGGCCGCDVALCGMDRLAVEDDASYQTDLCRDLWTRGRTRRRPPCGL